jgi:hypothetical protein
VATWFQLHPLKQLMRPQLVLVARGGLAAQFLHPSGEPVARALELVEAE